MQLADSHCHLNMLDLTVYSGDSQKCLAYARAQGVQYILNVCVRMQDFPTILTMALQDRFISASVGVHPDAAEADPELLDLTKAAAHPKVVAIGETGLDYYHGSDNILCQHERFKLHIRAAKAVQKPLIVHTRQAQEDTMRLLKIEQAQEVGGVLHCFTEDWHMAEQALDLGFYISLSGIVTFRNATNLQDVARRIPLERLLLETDAPYLAPVPLRGKPNEPANLVHTLDFVANLREMSRLSLAAATTANYLRLFPQAGIV